MPPPEIEDNDAALSEADEEDVDEVAEEADEPEPEIEHEAAEDKGAKRRKRKRKDADEELEDAYMTKLSRAEEKDNERLAVERAAKRQKSSVEASKDKEEVEVADSGEDHEAEESSDEVDSDKDGDIDGEESAASPPPKHETETQADEQMDKANRTVFLGNVSTDAITSKTARKALMNHLGSFFSKDGGKSKVESIRFRSTPYASAIPKKAAYAKQELMDATTKSTNAYAVYSSPALAREATRKLNGTMVLDRHLRVDSVAHPAKVDNRRCIFVGNLGFVSDETNIQAANAEEGREQRKPGKVPADVEEGLWRTFSKCGKVESVRVIRDSTTRVGKGIAYVQFEDENGVEAALLYNEKKFPPMLPRKLRVSRAKAQKRNATDKSKTQGTKGKTGYQRKLTNEEASSKGRAGKLLGRAGAATFEGHRATSKQGKSGLKLGGKHQASKKKRVTNRSAAYKAKQKK